MIRLPYQVSWQQSSEFIAAGSIGQIEFTDDLTSVRLKICYGASNELGRIEMFFVLECVDCSLVTIARLDGHTPGGGTILEAYVHGESSLQTDILTGKHDVKAGGLAFDPPSLARTSKYLEIVGEISVDIVCARVEITSATKI